MLFEKMDLQFFAHKKGQGNSTNGRDSNPQYRGVKKSGDASSRPATSWSDSAGRSSIPARTSDAAEITRFLP